MTRNDCRHASRARLLRPSLLAAALAGLFSVHAPAQAQDEAAPARSRGLVPTLTLSESYLRGNGLLGGVEGGEFVTRISPGLRWSSRAGRVIGSVDYSLDATSYSKRADGNNISNRLIANVQAEAIERFAFVDVQANVGQGAISATGQQYAFDPLSGGENRTQIANVQVSPYVVGRIGQLAEYQVRFGAAFTRARDVPLAESDTLSGLIALNSVPGAGRVGWGLTAQRQDLSFSNGRDTTTERVNARVSWQPDVDWLFFITGGQERTDVGGVVSRTYDNYGGGLNWSPSVRTRVALQAEKRYFGNSFNVNFEYRGRRTIWRFSDSRDAISGSDPNGFSQPITLFDLFFLQFASSVPDPIQRELAVREFLRLLGRDPNELLNIGALANAAAVQRRQELSAAWSGLRTTITVQAFATQLSLLDNPIDPSIPPTSAVAGERQRGVSASLSYRLSPRTAANGSVTYQTSPGGDGQPGNRLYGVSFGVAQSLGRNANLDVSARHSDYASATAPYRETAVTASVSLRF